MLTSAFEKTSREIQDFFFVLLHERVAQSRRPDQEDNREYRLLYGWAPSNRAVEGIDFNLQGTSADQVDARIFNVSL
jgi:hypothetical protein